MDILLNHLEAEVERYPDKSPLRKCIEEAWVKLNDYYDSTEESSAYVLAIVLDPYMKFEYFKRQWDTHPEWIKAAK